MPFRYAARPVSLPHLARQYKSTAAASWVATLSLEFQILIYAFQVYNRHGLRTVPVATLSCV